MSPSSPDSMYEAEVKAAVRARLTYSLVNFERLVYEGRPAAAVATVSPGRGDEPCGFRGWMMTPTQYEALYGALCEKGLLLINDPATYRFCHYLPENYPLIEPYTARTVWIPADTGFTIDRIMDTLAPFGDAPVVLKDFVKSQKHYWEEACFIPSASSRAEVERVLNRFLELQGDDLNGGIVFREFLPLKPLTLHSKSRMPLTLEYRCFVFDGDIRYATAYWDEGDYTGSMPPLDKFAAVARTVPSRFFTMDIAQHVDGYWVIIELGDAQVAGLPETADPAAFYELIAKQWPST